MPAARKKPRTLYFLVYRDRTGDWRWRLHAANQKVIADSAEGYRNRAHCLQMIRRIQRMADSSGVTVTPL